jgi:hypothetical protein
VSGLRRRRGEDGFSSVEVVIIAPALAVVIVLMVAFARAVTARSDLENAANAAARAGSLQRSYPAALAAARQVLAEDLRTECAGGPDPSWSPSASFAPGGDFVVHVSCAVGLLGVPGVPPDVDLHAVGVSPIDPLRGLS